MPFEHINLEINEEKTFTILENTFKIYDYKES